MNPVLTAIADQEGLNLIKSVAVSGGDINQAYRITTNNGHWFVKVNSSKEFPEMFRKEMLGLDDLRQCSLLKIPGVRACGEIDGYQYLLLEWLEMSPAGKNFWQLFAEGLARLHQNSFARFGYSTTNYIGSLRQVNEWHDTWADFYATQRILPLFRKLFDHGSISAADIKAAETFCYRLSGIFPNEPPALLHGDLWSGN